MDNLTHSLVGALIGQTGLKRKTGLAMPALIIGANLPDIDAACFFWLEGVEHLAFRRGITHGPIALVLLPLLLAGLLWSWDRWQASRDKRPAARVPVHFGWLFALSFLGCLTHPALDWLNVYGVRLLEPFSSRWFYGDVLFIIDVWLWAMLIGGVWWSRRQEKRDSEWRRPARVMLSVVLAYIGVNAAITAGYERANANAEGVSGVVIASPPPIFAFSRDVITGSNGLYAINGEALSDIPLDQCDLKTLAQSDSQVAAHRFWSRTPLVERSTGSLLLLDARYFDPRARDRFTAALPDDVCAELPVD